MTERQTSAAAPILHSIDQIEEELAAIRATVGSMERGCSVCDVAYLMPDLASLASQLLEERRIRSTVLPTEYFGEAAWDMLLDLYVAAEEGKQVSVSSLCIAANVPATTALRWINLLERQRKIARRNDPMDMRRHFLLLTEEARENIEDYLAQVQRLRSRKITGSQLTRPDDGLQLVTVDDTHPGN